MPVFFFFFFSFHLFTQQSLAQRFHIQIFSALAPRMSAAFRFPPPLHRTVQIPMHSCTSRPDTFSALRTSRLTGVNLTENTSPTTVRRERDEAEQSCIASQIKAIFRRPLCMISLLSVAACHESVPYHNEVGIQGFFSNIVLRRM